MLKIPPKQVWTAQYSRAARTKTEKKSLLPTSTGSQWSSQAKGTSSIDVVLRSFDYAQGKHSYRVLYNTWPSFHFARIGFPSGARLRTTIKDAGHNLLKQNHSAPITVTTGGWTERILRPNRACHKRVSSRFCLAMSAFSESSS
jgi:hypothetical protein